MKADAKRKNASGAGKPATSPARSASMYKPGRSDPKPIAAKVYVQDPAYAKQRAEKHARDEAERGAKMRRGAKPKRAGRGASPPPPVGQKKLRLKGEPWVGPGPTTSRLEVIDIDENEFELSKTEIAAILRDRAVKPLKSGGGFAIGSGSATARTRKSRQVNVWAVISHVLDHIESSKIFGRRLQWQFPGRLRIYPHWKENDDNAYYDREVGAVYFGYFYNYDDYTDLGEIEEAEKRIEEAEKRDAVVYLCLCHDTVSHELGHAVLDGLKPYYFDEGSAEEGGFSEFFSDALAMTSALSMREVVAAVVGKDPDALDGGSLISSIASQFGSVASTWTDEPTDCLRSAENSRSLQEVAPRFDRYEHSLVLTGAFYDILQALYALELELQREMTDRRKSGQRAVAALCLAADRTSRMMLRGLDYCPPAGLTYRAYAQAVMRADEVAFPVDSRGYRAIVADVFKKRGIVDSYLDLQPDRVIANNQLWPYDVDLISPSKPEAYAFLDRNRDVLEIPRNEQIDIVRIYRTNKIAAAGYRPPREIVVEFVWRKSWRLNGKRFGDLAGTRKRLWCGGTIVFDTNHNVLHYCLSDASPERRQRVEAYVLHGIGSGSIETAETSKAMKASTRIRARVVDGELELNRQPGKHPGGRATG